MAERDQNEGSGQQPPVGKQDDKQIAGQAGQQPSGAQGQQPLGQQGDFGDQSPQAQSGGQSATGETLSEGSEPDLGGGDVGPGGYSPESGASDLGGGETGLGDLGGGFVGSQSGEDLGRLSAARRKPRRGLCRAGPRSA